MEYNTTRAKLLLPEYGRNVQNMISYAMKIEDSDERNRASQAIIEVMGQLNPHLRDVDDYRHKLWTHLFIMSDFKLDVDSPFEKPELEKLFEKPGPLAYPNSQIRFNHYGKVIEMMIEEASKMKKGELRDKLIFAIANQMKKSYVNWNRDSVEDKLIFKQLEQLSNGKLSLPEETELSSVTVLKKGNNNRKKKQNNKHRNKRY